MTLESKLGASGRTRLGLVQMALVVTILPWTAVRADVKVSGDSTKMRVERLEITDPSKIHVTELPSEQKLRWRFQVYVPPSDDIILKASQGRGGSGVGWPKILDPVPVTVAILEGPLRHQPEVKWHLLVEFGGRRNTVALSPAQVAQIRQRLATSEVKPGTIVAGPNKPVKIKTLLPSIPGHFAEEFSGVEVWLEPSR